MSKLHQVKKKESISSHSTSTSSKETKSEITSGKVDTEDGSTFQSVSDYAGTVQNCTDILNEILTLSFQLGSDNVKSEITSIYLSLKNSTDDLTSNLTSFKTLTSDFKENATFKTGSSNETDNSLHTNIVAPVLIPNKEELSKFN